MVELVRDERTFRAASAVTVQGWERAEPDEVELASQLDEAIGDLATWSSFRVVAFIGGQPVSGGPPVPELRGRPAGCPLVDLTVHN